MTPTTTIQNDQLETELQELFLIAKQWNSDLLFLQCELEILDKLFKKASFILSKGDFDKLSSLNKTHIDLKNRIDEYLHTVQKLILNPSQNISISLLDTHLLLASELKQVLLRLQVFKSSIFNINSTK